MVITVLMEVRRGFFCRLTPHKIPHDELEEAKPVFEHLLAEEKVLHAGGDVLKSAACTEIGRRKQNSLRRPP